MKGQTSAHSKVRSALPLCLRCTAPQDVTRAEFTNLFSQGVSIANGSGWTPLAKERQQGANSFDPAVISRCTQRTRSETKQWL